MAAMRLALRQHHHARRKAGLRAGVGQAMLSKRANSATLRQNQKGRGNRLYLSVSVAEQRQPGMGHEREGHMPIPRMPMAHFILSQAGTAFGFLQEMLDVIARATDLGQDFERGVSGCVR